MLRTFYLDKHYGRITAYGKLVVLPYLIGWVVRFGNALDFVLGVLPFVSFLSLSFLLKLTINDWIEEAYFKSLRLKEKTETNTKSI